MFMIGVAGHWEDDGHDVFGEGALGGREVCGRRARVERVRRTRHRRGQTEHQAVRPEKSHLATRETQDHYSGRGRQVDYVWYLCVCALRAFLCSMTAGAQQALRRIIEIYSNSTRFALACNHSSKIIEPIQSRCTIVRFSPLTQAQILTRLLYICAEEKVRLPCLCTLAFTVSR